MLGSIDYALKKSTKDYSYVTMDYETKTFIRLYQEIYIELFAKFLATCNANLYNNTNMIAFDPDILGQIKIAPIVKIVPVLVTILWLMSVLSSISHIVKHKESN